MYDEILKNLDRDGKKIVGKWIKEAHLMRSEAWMKNIVRTVRQWERIKNHREYSIGWARQKIKQGYSFDDVVESCEGSGGYLIMIGIGIGAGLIGGEKVSRETIGVKIHGLGFKTFNGREIFSEARKRSKPMQLVFQF